MAGTPLGGFVGGGTFGLTATGGSYSPSKTTTSGGGGGILSPFGSPTSGGSPSLFTSAGGGTVAGKSGGAAGLVNAIVGGIIGGGLPNYGAGSLGGKQAGAYMNNPAGALFGGGSMGGGVFPGLPGAAPQAQQQPPQQQQPPPPPLPEMPIDRTPPRPRAEPVYTKWWFWAGIVGGVAVLGAGSYFLLRKSKKKAVAELEHPRLRGGW